MNKKVLNNLEEVGNKDGQIIVPGGFIFFTEVKSDGTYFQIYLKDRWIGQLAVASIYLIEEASDNFVLIFTH
jgi:hypothetical protein